VLVGWSFDYRNRDRSLGSGAAGSAEGRLAPANQAIGLDRAIEITVTPLLNFFAPRLDELPDV
jgi:hypothetical protein